MENRMPSSLTELLAAPLPELATQWSQRLQRHLPWPCHGEQSLFIGEPLLAVVSFSCNGVEVSQPYVEWASPTTPMLRMQPAGQLPLEEAHYDELLRLVEWTIQQRLRAFRECGRCGRRMAPEMLASLQGQPVCRHCLTGRRILF